MRIEAECVLFGSFSANDFLKTHVITPSNWKSLDFLGHETKVVIFCSQDGQRGSVLVNDPGEEIKAVKFENAGDSESKVIDPNSGMDVMGNQQLLIFTRDKKSVKQIIISLNSDNNQKEDGSFQGALNKEKAIPPTIAS